MPARTDTPWTNRWALPAILDNQPKVDGQARYTVKLPNGARYTVCRPQAAEDVASWAPQGQHAAHGRASFNGQEGLR